MMFFNRRSIVGRPLRGRGPANPHPVLRDGAFYPILVLALLASTCRAAPPPMEAIADDERLLELQSVPSVTASPATSAQALAPRIQTYLQQARRTGDPRYLGYAQRALEQWPEDRFTLELTLLRATLRQSLHQFGPARQDLQTVIDNAPPGRLQSQAWLTLSSIQIVQGHYGRARDACLALASRYPGLIAASCDAQVDARTGQAPGAYQRLSRQVRADRRRSDPVSLGWAEGTLADLAAQLGNPAAEEHWRTVLALNPDDIYTRTLYTDWLIHQGRAADALPLTRGYEKVDSLAVLRAIAQIHADQTDPAFVQHLEERFHEARWRGNLLHKRDYARFLLDVEGDASAALEFARANWETQREPLDTRLLIRAARAAGDADTLQQTAQWLHDQQQQDQRYPEVTL